MQNAQRGCRTLPPGPGWNLVVHVQNLTPVQCDETKHECMRYINGHVRTGYVGIVSLSTIWGAKS